MGRLGLKQWNEAFDLAAKNGRLGLMTLMILCPEVDGFSMGVECNAPLLPSQRS